MELKNLQDFAKSLLDVADNLGRALEIVQKSTSTADDAEANAKLLKSLLEGVEMTDKQLMKVCPCRSLCGAKYQASRRTEFHCIILLTTWL